MPELPEVEVVRKIISKGITNKKIIETKLVVSKALRTKVKLSSLNNETIKQTYRKGKQIVIETTNYFIALHLRMEGKLFYYPPSQQVDLKYTIIYFKLNKGTLVFYDFRKFATIDIYPKTKYKSWQDIPPISKLGPEPFNMKPNDLYNKIHNKRSVIKTLLLNQDIISGIGNIYVNEILYTSRISPHRLGKDITKQECKIILSNSVKILNKSIKYGGSTISSFKSASNHIGDYQKFLKVHGNKDMKFEKIGGRGTYWDLTRQK